MLHNKKSIFAVLAGAFAVASAKLPECVATCLEENGLDQCMGQVKFYECECRLFKENLTAVGECITSNCQHQNPPVDLNEVKMWFDALCSLSTSTSIVTEPTPTDDTESVTVTQITTEPCSTSEVEPNTTDLDPTDELILTVCSPTNTSTDIAPPHTTTDSTSAVYTNHTTMVETSTIIIGTGTSTTLVTKPTNNHTKTDIPSPTALPTGDAAVLAGTHSGVFAAAIAVAAAMFAL